MKLFLIYCTLILTCTSFKIHEADDPKLSLSAFIVAVESKRLSVRVTLTNNTSDTIKYVGWDCSWQNSYSVDTDKWRVIVNLCYKNGHKTFQIPPHQSESKVIELERMMGTTRSKTSAFKIGFHFIPPPAELINMQSKMEKFKQNDYMIWSDILAPYVFKKVHS